MHLAMHIRGSTLPTWHTTSFYIFTFVRTYLRSAVSPEATLSVDSMPTLIDVPPRRMSLPLTGAASVHPLIRVPDLTNRTALTTPTPSPLVQSQYHYFPDAFRANNMAERRVFAQK